MSIIGLTTPPALAPHWVKLMEGEYDVAVDFDEPPVILDIGGCIGVYARWARQRWPGCVVHIYEPNPKAHRMLEKNIAAIDDGRVSVNKVAVLGSRNVETGEPRASTIRLYQGRNNLGEASVFLETGAREDDFADVPVIFAKNLPDANIIKADCEGPEREILLEYLDTHDAPDVIAVEYHSAGEAKRMQTQLGERGYRCVRAAEYEPNRGVLIWRHEPGIG